MTTSLGIGLVAPHAGRAAGPDSLRDVAACAEELGLHSLWVGDHIVLPEHQTTPYPYRGDDDDGAYQVASDNTFYEAFQSLAFLAACTETVQLGLSVGILPYRHPLLWAKSIGTLAALSGDRVVLGAGAGWLREEFDALNLEFEQRGESTDEVLRTLREVWASDDRATTSNGTRVRVVPAFVESPPPVWIGGTGGRALRRVREYGDVWHPMLRDCPPAVVADSVARLEDARGESVPVALYATVAIESTPAEVEPWKSNELRGPSTYCAEVLASYADVGVTHAVISTGGGPRRRIDTVASILAELR